MKGKVVLLAESLLRCEGKPAGPHNVVFICPFHDPTTSTHKGWSFTLNIHTGACQCHSCKKGFKSLRTLARALGRGDDLALMTEIMAIPIDEMTVGLKKMAEIPEILLRLMADPYALLPQFSRAALDAFEVRHDPTGNALVYPLRDEHGVLVRLHARTLDPQAPRRYWFFDQSDFERYGFDLTVSGKEHAFLGGHRVFPAVLAGTLDQIIVAEGPKQCLRIYDAGYQQVIAPMGSIGHAQIRYLQLLQATFFGFFDNDDPGRAAAAKLHRELLGCSRVVPVDYLGLEKRQPDDLTVEEVKLLLTRQGVKPWQEKGILTV